MKNVLVTGGTRGLGLAITSLLAEQGFHVIATGRSLSPELEALVDCRRDQGKVSFASLELSRPEEIQEFVRRITSEHGALYGLVNNAALGCDGVLATMHESEIQQVIRINLEAAIVLSKYACRSMLVRREGRVINISSIIASTGFNGLSVYAATKAGLLGFTRSLARELGKVGITVNSICPGYMETDMTSGIADDRLAAIRRRSPSGQLATAEDVASTAAFLLSDGAKMINGTEITVDGGSTA